jgi:hypothetical protein
MPEVPPHRPNLARNVISAVGAVVALIALANIITRRR